MQQNQIYDIYISVGYLSSHIEAHLQKYNNTKINISIVKENKPLGTAGPLSLLKGIDDDLVVINGDILTDLNLSNFHNFFKSNQSLVTILTIPLNTNIPFGVLTIDENKYITNIKEKPTIKSYISGGCYIFDKKVIKTIPEKKYIEMTDFLEYLINKKVRISSYAYHGTWIDAGNWEDLKRAKALFV
ncbi:sugar phosphate nucleotidyltransferase [Staphylococcus aureus]|uniref:sugar phosphate nucleotidyltransferase n=1 Tax=Staphylococcus aureus TaxID=1280 RepID=UPI000DA51B06|nr:sugar phosphate nucleotidyltransferase [Staphylococcus aureus]SRF58179.1 glucose-1-phosphate adenylyltransferase [Staphylococcus aureus]